MKHYRVTSVSDIGEVVRAVRKTSGIRQDDAAGSAGVSHVYLRDLERGKESAQIGRALQVLSELGVKVVLDIPDEVFERLHWDRARAEKNALRHSTQVEHVSPKNLRTFNSVDKAKDK